ncbi:RNA polymerase II transcription factor B subunit 1 [Saitoella coloradoensis]
MATVTVPAKLKKKDGTLVLTDRLVWTQTGVPKPECDFPLIAITNLQRHPAKPQLKIHTTEPFLFAFDSVADRDVIQEAVTERKQQTSTPAAAPASTTSSSSTSSSRLAPEDKELLLDGALQQSLLDKSPALKQTFMEVVIKTMGTASQITTEAFWSTRLSLLRTAALESRQHRGGYNVLSTIKPVMVNQELKVSLPHEKIADIFEQHPVVRRVWSECVPPMSEDAFWSRFVQSRLCKKLRGQRITQTDPTDDVLDKYVRLEEDPDERSAKRQKTGNAANTSDAPSVPKFVDLGGNEANLTVSRGNAPDITMRPDRMAADAVGGIRSLNRISMRILEGMEPVDRRTGANKDELYREQIVLGDLRGEKEEERVLLNVTEDEARGRNVNQSEAVEVRDPQPATTRLVHGLEGEMSLADAVPDPESLTQTFISINTLITSQPPPHSTHLAPTLPLPPHLLSTLTMSHAATTEFLKHFWLAFLKKDYKTAGAMLEGLRRTGERVDKLVEAVVREGVSGGEAVVRGAMEGIGKAVGRAVQEYERVVGAKS